MKSAQASIPANTTKTTGTAVTAIMDSIGMANPFAEAVSG
jgi:hypothetical protein